MTTTDSLVQQQPSWVSQIWRASAPLRGAAAAGAVAGTISAGIGSRVVMRIIFLANEGARGAITDSTAIAGEITLSRTLPMLILGIVLGVIGGLVYLGLRRWLPVPAAWKGLAFSVVTLLTVGLVVFDTHNVDFQVFKPVVLVIALFAALFFVNGLILAPLMERIHPEPAYPHSPRVSRSVAALIAIVCLVGITGYADAIPKMIDDEGSCLSAVGGGNGCALRPPGVAP